MDMHMLVSSPGYGRHNLLLLWGTLSNLSTYRSSERQRMQRMHTKLSISINTLCLCRESLAFKPSTFQRAEVSGSWEVISEPLNILLCALGLYQFDL